MTMTFSVVAYDANENCIFSGSYSHDGTHEIDFNSALWQAITMVPREGYIVWEQVYEGKSGHNRKIICVDSYLDDEALDGKYVLSQSSTNDIEFDSREEYTRLIARNVHESLLFLHIDEFFSIKKSKFAGEMVIGHPVVHFVRTS